MGVTKLTDRVRRGRMAWVTAAVAAAPLIAGWQPSASAADFVWDRGNATFLWGDATNWNPDGVPGTGAAPSDGATDNVTFNSTTAGHSGTINLEGLAREVNSITFANDTANAYHLSNGTLTTGLITRTSPDQNNLSRVVGTSTLSLNAPGSGTLTINNSNTTSFFNIQGVITANTVTFAPTSAGRTVLGLTAGLTSADNNAVSSWVVNGGILETRSLASASYNSLGSGSVSLAAGSTLDLRGDATMNYGNAVALTGNASIAVNRSTGTFTAQTITLGPIAIGSHTLSASGANNYLLAAGTITLSGDPTFNISTTNMTVPSINAGGAARTITKAGPGIMTVTGAGTNFTGTTTATVTGALFLNNATALGTSVNYTLTSAAGVANPQLRVTGAGNAADTYTVPAGGIISGDNAFLGSLTVGADLLIASGANDDAIIAQTAAGGNNSVGNLPTTPTYLFGIAGNHSPGTITIGAGTPWKGISTDRSGLALSGVNSIRTFQTGVINTNGDFILQGLNIANAGGEYRLAIGNGTTAGSVTIAPTAPTSAIVRDGRVQLNDDTPVFNGNLTFDVQTGATVQLIFDTSLGTNATAAENANIIARSGATIDPNGSATGSTGTRVSGNVLFKQGAFLQLNDANNLQTGGAGAYTQEAGAITLVQNAAGLSGTGSPGTVPGSIVRLEVDNAASLTTKLDPGANIVVNANRTVQSMSFNSVAGVNVPLPEGGTTPTGVFTNDATSRNPTNTGVTNITTITLGANGGVVAATTGTTLTLTSIANNTSGGWVIDGPGTLQIGAAGTIQGLAKAGVVSIGGGDGTTTNPSNYGITAGAVNIVAGRLENLSGGMKYNIGTPAGTGFTTVSAGAEFRSTTGTLSNTRLNLLPADGATPAGIARFSAAAANVASIEGAGSVVIGPATADATSRTLTVGANNLDTTFSGVLSQSLTGVATGSVIKTGTGAWTLSGANTYTGTTTINGGTLLANNAGATSATGTGAVTVNAGGTLAGTGRVAGSVAINLGGTVSPGAGNVGTLSIAGPVTLGTGGTGAAPSFAVELHASSSASLFDDSDVLALTGAGAAGALNLSNPDQLSLTALSAITTPTTYTIATFAPNQLTGTFESVLVNGVLSQSANVNDPNYASVAYNAADGNIQVTVNNLAAVPEPATAGVLAAVGLGLLARRRRQVR